MKRATKTMKRILNTLLAGIFIFTFGCVPGSNVNLTQGSRGLPGIFPGIQAHQNSSAMQSVSHGESEQQRMQELIQKIKNKTPYTGPIDIKIDTGLLDKNNVDRKVLTVKSSVGGFSTQALPTGPIVFQEQFVRDKNPIKGEKREFTVSDTSKVYTLHIQNGDAGGNNTVSSAAINLNGVDFVRPNDFNGSASLTTRGKQTLNVQKDAILLNANNTMTIDVSGSPGSTMIVTVIEGGQAGTIRRKNGPLNEHPDQAAHVAGNDVNIFDPAEPNSLGELEPFDGDFISKDGNTQISKTVINGTDEAEFEATTLILEFNNPLEGLQLFQSLYGAIEIEKIANFSLIKVNLDKSPIYKFESLLNHLNQGISVDITEATFSSIAAFKLFVIALDIIVNHYDIINSIDLNFAGKSLSHPEKAIFTNDWAISSGPLIGDSWWLRDTHVLEAWNYSLGTGINVGLIDGGAYNKLHKEITRRLLYERGNENINTDKCSTFDIDCWSSNASEGKLNHFHYVLMAGFAERDNNIPSAGVAPNARLIPYHRTSPWEIALAIREARKNGAHVIGTSMGFPKWSFDTFLSPTDKVIGFFTGHKSLHHQINTTIADYQIPIIIGAGNDGKDIKNSWIGSDPRTLDLAIIVGNATIDPFSPRNSTMQDHITGLDKPNLISFATGAGRFRIGSNFGKNVIWAPGQGVKMASYNENEPPKEFGGTSGASPFVSGIVALMKSRNMGLSPAQIKNILLATADYVVDGSALGQPTNLPFVDVLKAVKAAIGSNPESTHLAKEFVGKLQFGSNSSINLLFNSNLDPRDTFSLFDERKQSELIQSVSDEKWNDLKNKNGQMIKIKGWTNIRAGDREINPIPNRVAEPLIGKIEILEFDNFSSIPIVTNISPLSLRKGEIASLSISGENIFLSNSPLKLIMKNQSNSSIKEFTMDFNSSEERLNNAGTFAKFVFSSTDLDSLQSGSYRIAVKSDNGVSNFSSQTITILERPPLLSSISPQEIEERVPGNFTLIGQNLFLPGDIKIDNNVFIPASNPNSNHTSVGFSLSPNNLNVGNHPVHFANNSGTSNSVNLEVIPASEPPPVGGGDGGSGSSKQFTIDVFNVDDLARVYINVNNFLLAVPVIEVGFNQTAFSVNITPYLNPGQNTIDLWVWNYSGGYTWGFYVRENGSIIKSYVDGVVGVTGARNNDQTLQNQWVFGEKVNINN